MTPRGTPAAPKGFAITVRRHDAADRDRARRHHPGGDGCERRAGLLLGVGERHRQREHHADVHAGPGAVFPIATTNVTCTATDGKGNGASATFRVTVRDTTAPVFSQVPVGPIVEADGPGGSRVTYTPPIAVDLVSGPVLVSCSPAPGSTFPRGTTTVTCSAKDARGNAAAASFPVRVVDTTKPALNVPQPQDVSSNGAQTLSRDDPQVQTFLASAQARDVVDGNLPVKNDAPAVFRSERRGSHSLPPTRPATRRRAGGAERRHRCGVTDEAGHNATQGRHQAEGQARRPVRRPHLGEAHCGLRPSPRQPCAGEERLTDDGRLFGVRQRAEGHEAHERRRVPLCRRRLRQGRGLLTRHRRRATPVRPLLYAPASGEAVSRPPQLRWAGVTGASVLQRPGLPGSVVRASSPGRRSSAPGRRRHS